MLRASGKVIVAVTILTCATLLAACGKGPHLLYGLLEGDGQWAITPRYTDAAPPQEGLSAVKIDGAWGFVDAAGKTVIEPRFDEVLPFSEGLAAVRQDVAWSFIDATGAVAIAGPFDAAEPFRGGLAAVGVDDRWGFVNHAGVMVIAPMFEELGSYNTEIGPARNVGCFSEGLCAAQQGDKWGFIDRSGAWAIPPNFQSVSWFEEGLACAQAWRAEDALNAPVGFIDRHGEWVIEPRFDDCLWFNGGRAVVMVELPGVADATDAAANDDPEYGVDYRSILIDRRGREMADVGWDAQIFAGAAAVLVALAPDYLAEGMVPASDGGLWGFMDRDGRWVIPPQYVLVFPFKDGLAPAALGDASQGWNGAERWGLIDRAGRRVVEPELAMIGPWDGASIPAKRGALWGLLDRDGRWVVEPRYPEAQDWLEFPGTNIATSEGFFRFGVYANHRWGAVDPRGHRSKPVEYEWLEDLAWWSPDPGEGRPKRLAYLRDGLWGLADERLQPVTPAQFDSAPMDAGDNLLRVEKGGLSGCIDTGGKWIVPAEFAEIEECGRDEVRARKDTAWGAWQPGSGWRPLAAGEREPAIQEGSPEWVVVTASAIWRPVDGAFRLFRDGVLQDDVPAADEVRGEHMQATAAAGRFPLAVVRRGDRWGALDDRGEERLPVRFEAVGSMFEGLYAVKLDGTWRIVDGRGRQVIAGGHDELRPFNRRVAIACREGMCGLVGRDGSTVLLPPGYSAIRPITPSLAEALILHPDDSVKSAGVIDATGRVLVGQDYYSVSAFSDDLLLAWDAKGRYSLLQGDSGQPVPGLPELAGRPGQLSQGLAAVDLQTPPGQERAGYIDATGRLVIAAVYDAESAEDFHRGTAIVSRDGRCGVIDKRGRTVLPTEYQHCQRLADGRVLYAEEAPLRIAAPPGRSAGVTPPPPGSPAP